MPLLISLSAAVSRRARASAEGVEIIDLLPTIVDALGGKVPADAQGESLVPLAQGEGAGYPRPAIASQYELAHAMRLGRWKLWVVGSGDVRLFDAVADAAEAKELSTERPLERRFVTDALGVWMAYQGQWKKSRWGVASNQQARAGATILEDYGEPLPADDLVGVGAHERGQPADLGVAATRVEAARALVPVRDEQEQVARARGHVGFDGVEERAAGALPFGARRERDQAQIAADAERARVEVPGEAARARRRRRRRGPARRDRWPRRGAAPGASRRSRSARGAAGRRRRSSAPTARRGARRTNQHRGSAPLSRAPPTIDAHGMRAVDV